MIGQAYRGNILAKCRCGLAVRPVIHDFPGKLVIVTACPKCDLLEPKDTLPEWKGGTDA